MLVAFMQRVTPTDRTRSISLIDSWKLALKTAKKQDRELWLSNLEKVYGQCKKVALTEVQGHRPLWDFLEAVDNITPRFANYWRGRLN
ncbi:MAG: hypothetical protein MMC33_008229, partial [Icmadophila ericetorum]|nr:hypothetical protein [Icmadophila ericetorum]